MLFKTIPEIKNFLPIGVGNDFMRLKPHIQNAENKYIKPVLGAAMFDELQEFYDTEPPGPLTEVQEAMQQLLLKTQHSLIHLAYFIGFDFLNVNVSDAGFQRIGGERTKGLYKYQEENLKTYFSDAGFNALDDMLVFIEENIQHFGEFKAEKNWTDLKTAFLPSVAVVENIPFNLHGSRLTFMALRPFVAFIEDTVVRPVIGQAIYDEIKAEMAKDQPAAKVTAILPYIRKPLIYLASALLMDETGATLFDKGLYFEKTTGNQPDNKIKGPSTDERIAAAIARNQMIGNSYLDQLKSYLLENWDAYAGTAQRLPNRDNNGKKTFWT